MKLTIGIFNALLVLMIILILHFIIIHTIKKESFQDIPACDQYEVDPINKNLESDKENMLKYVLEDPSDNDLDNYFKDYPVLDVKDDGCKNKTDNNQLPLSTTCDPKIQTLSLADEMKVISDCELPQDKKHYTLLKEYAEEKPQNGGLLYGNISAYDEEDLYFSKI
jgi:hypothetical protein